VRYRVRLQRQADLGEPSHCLIGGFRPCGLSLIAVNKIIITGSDKYFGWSRRLSDPVRKRSVDT